jgi:hypothetical protein
MSNVSDQRERRVRAAQNQSLFREVNERIETLNASFDGLLPIGDWICECADDACIERISLTLDKYEAVRAQDTWFIVAAGHFDGEVERIVERSDRYWVVEKFGVAASVAARANPRRRA